MPDDDAYDVCTWHPDRVASWYVRAYTPGGATLWKASCDDCAEDFNSKEIKPWT